MAIFCPALPPLRFNRANTWLPRSYVRWQAPLQRFVYHHRGDMATIGRAAAVADIKGIHLSGYPAWLAWLFVHLINLIGFRNRISVLFQWFWSYVTYRAACG